MNYSKMGGGTPVLLLTKSNFFSRNLGKQESRSAKLHEFKYTVMYTMLHELKNTAAVGVSAYILLTGVRSKGEREKIDTIIITSDYNYLLQMTTDYNYLLIMATPVWSRH